jgi:hypothetical protein
MADIKDQLIKDSYNYVLQSDLSTGVVYRIGGTIPINPIFSSGLTINGDFNYSNGTEQPGYVLTTNGSGSTYWGSSGISGSGTSNYLPKWSGSTSLVNSLVYDSSTGVTIGTGFTWNNTNSRLGIDILNPTSKLQIKGNGTTNATTTFITQNNSNSVNGTIYDDGTWFFGGSNTRLAAIGGQFDFNSAAGNISRIGHWEMFFRPLQAGSVSLELSTNIRMLNTNVLIGTSTDAGFKLDVNGTSRFVSQITMGNGITGNGNVITTPNSGGGFYGNFFGSVGSPFVYNQTSIFATGGGSVSVTGGSRTSFIDTITWQQSSGNADFSSFRVSPTINQTGTASGITRGLYVNPTISAATDFRAIETTTGNVLFGTGFTWDNTNSRLNVGTNLGAYGVTWIQSDVASTTDYTLVLNNRNTLGVGGEATGLYFANSGYGAASQPYNTGHIVGSIKTLATNFNNVTTRGVMTFNLNNSSSVQEEVMRLVNTTKNVLIGTTTDAGYKLDVNGSGRIGTTNYYLTLANGGADGGILRVGGASYGYAELVSYSLRLNGGHTLYGTGGTNEFGLASQVAPLAAGATNGGALVFKADNNGAVANRWSDFPNALAFNFIKKETSGSYTSLLSLNGSTNNVGIGTITPTYKLDVFGSGTTAGISSNVGLNIQPVAAPIVTSLTYTLQSGSSLGVGTYYYRVTYYNAIGETSASNTIPVITLSGSQVVQLNNIPISTDTTVIGRKIYRDKLGDGSAYGVVVGTISNNTGTTYTDSLPDSDPVFSGSFLTRPIYAKANTTVNYISVGGVRSMIADPSLTTFGVSAGAAITVAPAVTLFGANAGQKITYGAGNTLFGYLAGFNIVGGFQNVAIGEGALAYGVVSGSYNVGLGPYVLCKEGSFNIAMGYYTGNGVTGSRNVLIGGYIGSSTSSYNDAIIIGHNATPLSATSYQINIGNTIYGRTNTGNVMIGTTTDAGYKLDVNGSSAFRGRVNIFGEAELRQDGITQIFSSAYGIFQLRAWSTGGLTAYLNAWNYEGYLNFALNIGTSSTAVASAVLELTSTTRGFLPPRMTLSQRDAISSPATGLTVYQTTNNYLSLFNGTNWQNIVSPNSNGNVLIGKTTDSGQKLQVSGDTLLQGSLTATTKTTIGSESDISCALLQMASTTQGVLFPRMTNTQRTSISTPVAGLMVYCTDSPEGLFIYKSTGWVQII